MKPQTVKCINLSSGKPLTDWLEWIASCRTRLIIIIFVIPQLTATSLFLLSVTALHHSIATPPALVPLLVFDEPAHGAAK